MKKFFCAALLALLITERAPAEENKMLIKVTDGTNAITFRLNGSPQAKSLYDMLPFDADVENYSDNEKIFYPPKKINAENGIGGGGGAGTLALFSPWGNVVMYYGSFNAYPGLYLMGRAEDGAEKIKKLSGNIHVEAAND